MTDDVRSRVAELTSLVDGTVRFTLRFFSERDWQPAAASPAARELENDEHGREEPWGRGPVETAHTICSLSAIAATDHLASVGLLSDPPAPSILGGTAMARVAIEAASQAWWLLEPDIGARGRVERSTAVRLAGLRDSLRVMERMMAPMEVVEERRARVSEVLHQAKELRLPLHRRDGEPVALKAGVPGREDLAAQAFASLGVANGGGIYAFLSGVVHTAPWAVLQFTDLHDERHPDRAAAVQPRLSLADLEHAVWTAVAGHIAMCDRLFPYYGFDSDLWRRWRLHALKVVVQR